MIKPLPENADYALLAQVLRDLAKTVASLPPAGSADRENLRDAAKALYLALEADAGENEAEKDVSEMTPEEEVQLLHILE